MDQTSEPDTRVLLSDRFFLVLLAAGVAFALYIGGRAGFALIRGTEDAATSSWTSQLLLGAGLLSHYVGMALNRLKKAPVLGTLLILVSLAAFGGSWWMR